VALGARSRAPFSSISITTAAAGDALSLTTTGAKLRAGVCDGRADLPSHRQRKSCAGVRPRARATALTLAPGARLSAMI
jgi:hypothetical protein